MRILLLNDYEPQGLTLRLAQAFESVGHSVAWAGTSRYWGHPAYLPNADLPALLGEDKAHFDVALITDDNWMPNIPRGIERLGIPTILVSFDYQTSPMWFDPLLPLFDHLVLLNRDPALRLAKKYPSVHWIPAAVDPSLFPLTGQERTTDIAIVGGMNPAYPRRVERQLALAARYKTNDLTRHYSLAEMGDLYCRSKIVVNFMAEGVRTLSHRTWEGMAAGALTIVEETDSGLDELFQRGRHLVTFQTDDELYRIIDYYLAHDDDRVKIANAGCSLVRRDHTWEHRVRQMLDIVSGAGDARPAPARRMSNSAVARLYVAGYARRLQFDPLLDLLGSPPPLWSLPLILRIVAAKLGLRRGTLAAKAQKIRKRLKDMKAD